MQPTLLLVGNGPYANRGCEAIVRGTVELLRSRFGAETSFALGVFAGPAELAQQRSLETDPRVRSFTLDSDRWSPARFARRANRALGTKFFSHPAALRHALRETPLVLEVGGDNYSLDYGRPERYLRLDDDILRSGRPLYLWGASVGPFEKDPDFCPRMLRHLGRFTRIFVRETVSEEYLHDHGLGHLVTRVADPAFVMSPQAPAGSADWAGRFAGRLGVNLSPIMHRYRPGWSFPEWQQAATEFLRLLLRDHERLVLVPHVFAATLPRCDLQFMSTLVAGLAPAEQACLELLPGHLTAAELKWCISHFAAFVGARTHSTIAALSTGVPTLSLGYSRKATGINRDLFGNDDYVLPVAELTPAAASERTAWLWSRRAETRQQLQAILPRVRAEAAKAAQLVG